MPQHEKPQRTNPKEAAQSTDVLAFEETLEGFIEHLEYGDSYCVPHAKANEVLGLNDPRIAKARREGKTFQQNCNWFQQTFHPSGDIEHHLYHCRVADKRAKTRNELVTWACEFLQRYLEECGGFARTKERLDYLFKEKLGSSVDSVFKHATPFGHHILETLTTQDFSKLTHSACKEIEDHSTWAGPCIYTQMGFDSDGKCVWTYVGKSDRVFVRWEEHLGMMASMPYDWHKEPNLHYQLAKKTKAMGGTTLEKVLSKYDQCEPLRLVHSEALFSALMGSFQCNLKYLTLRAESGLPSVPFVGANSTPSFEMPSKSNIGWGFGTGMWDATHQKCMAKLCGARKALRRSIAVSRSNLFSSIGSEMEYADRIHPFEACVERLRQELYSVRVRLALEGKLLVAVKWSKNCWTMTGFIGTLPVPHESMLLLYPEDELVARKRKDDTTILALKVTENATPTFQKDAFLVLLADQKPLVDGVSLELSIADKSRSVFWQYKKLVNEETKFAYKLFTILTQHLPSKDVRKLRAESVDQREVIECPEGTNAVVDSLLNGRALTYRNVIRDRTLLGQASLDEQRDSSMKLPHDPEFHHLLESGHPPFLLRLTFDGKWPIFAFMCTGEPAMDAMCSVTGLQYCTFSGVWSDFRTPYLDKKNLLAKAALEAWKLWCASTGTSLVQKADTSPGWWLLAADAPCDVANEPSPFQTHELWAYKVRDTEDYRINLKAFKRRQARVFVPRAISRTWLYGIVPTPEKLLVKIKLDAYRKPASHARLYYQLVRKGEQHWLEHTSATQTRPAFAGAILKYIETVNAADASS